MKAGKSQTPILQYTSAMLILSFLLSSCSNSIFLSHFQDNIASAQTVTNNINPVFESILSTLKSQTKIPILLPTYIPPTDQEQTLYATITTANNTEYLITLGISADCNGGNWCDRLSIYAGSEEPQNNPEDENPERVPVLLKNGVTGYFSNPICGASCSESFLSWKQDNYYYTVGSKSGNKEELIEIANSMTQY